MNENAQSLEEGTETSLTGPIEVQLVNRRMPRGSWSPAHLEEVRDQYQMFRATALPYDFERPGNHFRFLVPNGHPPSLQMITSDGGMGTPLALTKTALSQFTNAVLVGGKKFYNGLLALASMEDPESASGMHRQLAEAVVNEFLQRDEKLRLVRTFGRLPSHGPVVRAFLSQSYSIINDIDLLQALLDNADTANLPVLEVRSTDAGTRIRLALDPSVGYDQQPELGKPIELLEVWNSEVGRRGIWAVLGIWKLVCTNGLTGFDEKLRYIWRHSGRKERILSGVNEFIQASKTKVSGVLEAYRSAAEVHIQKLLGFVKALGTPNMPEDMRLTNRQVDRVTQALSDPTTTRTRSNELTLASVVDAMTLTAQGEKDVFEAERIEHSAGYVLRRGLSASAKAGGTIEVQVEEDKALVAW